MTADELVAKVRFRVSLAKTTTITDQSIIDAANEELIAIVTQAIMRSAGEILTDSDDIPTPSGQAEYPLPVRSVEATVRLITWVDANGNESPPLQREELANLYAYGTAQGDPFAFYFKASTVVLLPTPLNAGTLRVRYARRSGDLVQDLVVGGQHTQVGIVQSVAVAGGNSTVTLTANHNGWPAGKTLDFTGAAPPHRLMYRDLAATTAVAGTATILVPGVDLTPLLKAGDYVTQSLQTYVPQMPREWHSLLMLRASARMAADQKDRDTMKEILGEAMEMEKRLVGAEGPRSGQNPRRISAWRGINRRRY